MLSTVLALVLSTAAHADSPLTSTDFHVAYSSQCSTPSADSQMCREFAQPKLTPSKMEFLANQHIALDKRLAIVNAMGWQFGGLDRASGYKEFVSARRGGVSKLTGEDLVIVGYMKLWITTLKLAKRSTSCKEGWVE